MTARRLRACWGPRLPHTRTQAQARVLLPGSRTTSSGSLSEERARLPGGMWGGHGPRAQAPCIRAPRSLSKAAPAPSGALNTRVLMPACRGEGSGWVRADGGGVGRARKRSSCAGTARADAGKECAEERPYPQESHVEKTEETGAARLRSGLCLRHVGTPGGSKSREQRTDLCGLGWQAAGSW